MFHPGDIVVLKEPDDGDEEAVIFVCYTKLYDDEFDCVLIERYGMEKNSTFHTVSIVVFDTQMFQQWFYITRICMF